jgi:putative inorganic carbon (HCO3(-)) transporter
MMTRSKTIAAIITIASLTGLAFSVLLLHSEKIAIILYSGSIGFFTLLLEPFIGLINYLIFLYVRPQEFVQGFVGLPIMLMVGGGTFIVMILHYAVVKRSFSPVRAPQNFLMLAFLAAIMLSHLSHLYMHGALNSGRVFLSTLVMYLIIVNLITGEAKLRVTMYVICLLTLFLAVQGIRQYYTGVGWGGQTMISGRIRGIGIFADPNDLALTFLIVMPFVFLILFDCKSVLIKLFSITTLVVLVYALYLTGSRGGFLGFGLLAFLLIARRYGLAPGLLAAVVVFVIVIAAGPPRYAELSPTEESAYGRIEAWGAGLSMLKENPFFGVGAGRFLDFHVRTAHNSIVLCASELGLFGLYIWMLLIFVSMRNLFFVGSEARARGMASLALFSDSIFFAFAAFLATAFFLSRTYNDLLYVLIGLSVAVTSIFVTTTQEKYQLLEKKDFLYTLILMMLVLFMLKVITKLFW